MTIRLSHDAYKTLQELKDPDVKALVRLDNQNEAISFDDLDKFMQALDESIPFYGMTEGFEDVTPYGRKLYALYDEIYDAPVSPEDSDG